MVKQDSSLSETVLISKKKDNMIKSKSNHFKKYRVKISMLEPYETVDFWVGKPDENSVLELFMHELFSIDPSKYFKIQMSEV